MATRKVSEELNNKTLMPPSKDSKDNGLDLTAPLSLTGITHGYSTPARSSSSLDIRPLPSSSDIFKFEKFMESLHVSSEYSYARGVKRKYIGESGPRRKRQKRFHFKHSRPERGVKRKRWSDHKNKMKRLKTWHKSKPASFQCPRTCTCHVGQSRVIQIKRRGDKETPLLQRVLNKNLQISASTSRLNCCENECFA